MDEHAICPIAIGGIGGSGTRIGTALLRRMGFYLGDDLNGMDDNLWYTLLFKRHSVLLDSRHKFESLFQLFCRRMDSNMPLTSAQRREVFELAKSDRLQEPSSWLNDRAANFCSGLSSKNRRQPWGWKEPNTHIAVERVLESNPNIKYIHFVRHPLDMAFSSNRNQLLSWGAILLDRAIGDEPKSALDYWLAAHRRVAAIMGRWPERTLLVDFDEICTDPDAFTERVAAFAGTSISEVEKAAFRASVVRPASSGRFRTFGLDVFDARQLKEIAEFGYEA